MIEYSQNVRLDEQDKAILKALQTDGRIRNSELARRVNLSAPAVHARLRRLEEQGYIRQYAALVDHEKVGYDMLCFVHMTLQLHHQDQVEAVRSKILEMPEVLECYHLTGEYDYLLKVVIRNRKDLERFVMGRLTPIPGIGRVHTSLVLTEVKATTALPIS